MISVKASLTCRSKSSVSLTARSAVLITVLPERVAQCRYCVKKRTLPRKPGECETAAKGFAIRATGDHHRQAEERRRGETRHLASGRTPAESLPQQPLRKLPLSHTAT